MHKLLFSALLVLVPLLLFCTFRVLLFLVNYDYFAVLSGATILRAFLEGLRFDLSIILSFYIWPLAILSLPVKFVLHKYIRSCLGIMMYLALVAGSWILSGDIAFFAHSKRHSGSEILLLGNDLDFVTEIILADYKLVTLIFCIVAIVGIKYWLRLCTMRLKHSGFIINLGQGVLIIALSYLSIFGVIAGKRINVIDAYRNGNNVYGNLVLNGAFSAYHVSRASNTVNYKFFKPETMQQLHFIKQYPNNKPTNYNIVVVLLESWSAHYIDSLSRNNYRVTPNFDKLVSKSIVFPNFYAANTTSIPALQATLAGVPHLMGMPYWGKGLEVTQLPSIGTMANDLGYRTIFVQSSKRRSFRIDAVAQAAGFSEFYGKEDVPTKLKYPTKKNPIFGWDYDTYMFLHAKLDAGDKPFFAYLFTGTTHDPYIKLPKQFNRYPHHVNNESGFLNTLYYADWALGEFMHKAQQSTWFKNTVFIFLADHTVGHSRGHSVDSMFKIPCIIYAPHIFKPKIVTNIGSQLDIFATIVDLLGRSKPFPSIGTSLLRKTDPFALVINNSLVGAVTDVGYVSHNMNQKISEKTDGMPRRLLELLQLTYTKLQDNTWMELNENR
ncbi:MAG: hypothetical protein COC15_02795 [Legionellales bacterium]|nr:MAG: hypothetical protein COC15_02795 [Legionellales bacterium]